MASTVYADWSMLLDSEQIGLAHRYYSMLIQAANNTFAKEHPEEPLPDLDDIDSIIADLSDTKKNGLPSWWPDPCPRINIKIKLTQGGVNYVYGPSIFEPRGSDTGFTTVKNIVNTLIKQAPVPFQGNLQIEFLLLSGASIGGYNGNVRVGSKKLIEGEEDEAWIGGENAYLRKRFRESSEANLAMFNSSAQVIQASAAVIASTKGVGEKEGDDGTIWEKLGVVGATIVQSYLESKDGEKENTKKESLQIPERKTPLLTSGEYPSHIDPAGTAGDDWGTQEDEPVPEATIEEEEEEESTEAQTNENPLVGKSPAEVATLMEAWIATQKGNKSEIRKMGMKLAGKLV